MKRRLSVANLSSENNLPMFRVNAPVIIRVKVFSFMQKPTEKPLKVLFVLESLRDDRRFFEMLFTFQEGSSLLSKESLGMRLYLELCADNGLFRDYSKHLVYTNCSSFKFTVNYMHVYTFNFLYVLLQDGRGSHTAAQSLW